VIVAVSPSPALDGVLAGLRGLSLLRQVATLHGMRPGGAVTLALLRRLAWTAAGTSGLDLLGQTLADGALAHVPVLRQLATVLPGSGLMALRLRRLAEVTAQACCPFDDGSAKPRAS
jgi:putative membrane protein